MDKTTNDIYAQLIPWIRAAIGDETFTVIVGHQRAEEPQTPYCSMYMLSNSSVGMGAVHEVLVPESSEGAGDQYIDRVQTQLYRMEISIQFCRDGSHENMRKLMHFPNTEKSYYMLTETNLVIQVPRSYRNLDMQLGDGWVRRTQMDLILISSTEYAETVGVIEEVGLSINNENILEE